MCVTLENVSRVYEGRRVLDGVSLTLPRRGAVCFFGPSGCGKTTILRLICGLDKPDAGKVIIPPGTRFACHFQEDRLLPWYTARENLTLVMPEKEANRLLAATRLEDAADRFPDELSGGMRRRLSLARALGYPSDVLVLDEPLRELDEATADAMLELIRQAARDRLLILVTHDRAQAEALGCDIHDFPL